HHIYSESIHTEYRELPHELCADVYLDRIPAGYRLAKDTHDYVLGMVDILVAFCGYLYRPDFTGTHHQRIYTLRIDLTIFSHYTLVYGLWWHDHDRYFGGRYRTHRFRKRRYLYRTLRILRKISFRFPFENTWPHPEYQLYHHLGGFRCFGGGQHYVQRCKNPRFPTYHLGCGYGCRCSRAHVWRRVECPTDRGHDLRAALCHPAGHDVFLLALRITRRLSKGRTQKVTHRKRILSKKFTGLSQ